jgi:D-threo-aldose 1-dehydrogenase
MTSTPGGSVHDAAPPATVMTGISRRALGRSSIEVTELALGAAALGNLYAPVDDGTATATVDAAWEAGVRTFDTAPHYGLGLSERRLGAALRHRPRNGYTISTKVGRILEPVDPPYPPDDQGFAVPATHRRRFDFTADGIRRSLESSLERHAAPDFIVAPVPDAPGRRPGPRGRRRCRA